MGPSDIHGCCMGVVSVLPVLCGTQAPARVDPPTVIQATYEKPSAIADVERRVAIALTVTGADYGE
ncbi:hypothetical protein D3C85_1713150 [compost metagenome]